MHFNTKNLIKSPINYIGRKYKLLEQMFPFLPNNVDTFYDLTCGSGDVGLNVTANKVVFNDINVYLVDLLESLYTSSVKGEDLIQKLDDIIKENGIVKEERESFVKFRGKYNTERNPLYLYILTCFTFSNMIRFNNNHEFNAGFAGDRNFNASLREKLTTFLTSVKDKQYEFTGVDFTKSAFDYKSNDLVYLDPPYLITNSGSYNDGKRGFKGWGEQEEKEMYNFLADLRAKGIPFAMSNVLEHDGKSNDLLKEFCEEYKLTVNYLNMKYNATGNKKVRGNSVEVLITNY